MRTCRGLKRFQRQWGEQGCCRGNFCWWVKRVQRQWGGQDTEMPLPWEGSGGASHSKRCSGHAPPAHLGAVGDEGGVEVDAVEADLAVAEHAQQLRDHAHARHQRPQYDVAQHAL